ncbi:MAG: adenylyl-sulfate kinase [Rhodospirillaceae bacterium]|jgi:cytidine diphosphoramidate kinase|nr:adenylyl-sulfate kinase [Rhodospirillaceae bacterium]
MGKLLIEGGIVIWITGLSGVGKSTISRRVADIIRERGDNCILLDGDDIRRAFPEVHSGHDRDSRIVNAQRNSSLAKLLADQGHIVIFATMSLFSEVQAWNRKNFPAYLEIFVDVPMDVLKSRDSEELYQKAEQGLIENVVGVHLDYDIPQQPDLVVDNSGKISKVDTIAQEIIELIP